MSAMATAGTGRIFLQASTVGSKDFTGIICGSALRNFYGAGPEALLPSIAFTPEFLIDNGPTVSSGLHSKRLGHFRGMHTVKIGRLVSLKLTVPLGAIIEPDDDAFIARSVDLPVFGFADDPIEALESLKREIESLYYDLMVDDNFSPQWLAYKEFLCEKVVAT